MKGYHVNNRQDGYPYYYALAVLQFLNVWIGSRGAIEWAVKSPDLLPLNYFLWRRLKSEMYDTEYSIFYTVLMNTINSFCTIVYTDPRIIYYFHVESSTNYWAGFNESSCIISFTRLFSYNEILVISCNEKISPLRNRWNCPVINQWY